MTGRHLCSDEEAMRRGFGGADCARRRQVLKETIAAFEQSDPPDLYHRLAMQNLDQWRAQRGSPEPGLQVQVLPGDWGEVTRVLTRTHGVCFAVLNMADAYVPGGAYVEGGVAQEENMFRRSDCHFRVVDDAYDDRLDRYRPEMTRLLAPTSTLRRCGGESRHSWTRCAITGFAMWFSVHSAAVPFAIRLTASLESTGRRSRCVRQTSP